MAPLLAAWYDVFTSDVLYETLIWIAVSLLLIVGFLGTFIPALPGTTLVLAGAFLFYFTMGKEASGLAWQSLVFITLLYLLSILLDGLSGAIGAKRFGSSKWGIVGAILGGIIGLFFGIPGLIIGPILGVFLFELLIARKKLKEAGNSTVGTVLGGLAGIVARIVFSIGMIIWFIVDVFFVN